jgi:hypothetical protein
MSRRFLLLPIILLAFVFAWFAYDEVKRARTLTTQHELLASPVASTPDVSKTSQANNAWTISEPRVVPLVTEPSITEPSVTEPSEPIETQHVAQTTTVTSGGAATNTLTAETATSPTTATLDSQATNSENVTPEATATTSDEPTTSSETTCSSLDEASLMAAFDLALADFLANASALYGSSYENLQYQLSSKTATLAENQGTVSVNYSGNVKELSTGQDVSANGSITATFSWDGCSWQMVNYSFT